ncbi:DeoR/GlpR family DNA-binding transcription regulator [Neisseria animalis]|uniref:DeoR/GlpR transcriptional regulator n=1 Tax=Neisseria animalis TaxID=492 RepID=A0A5P3MRS9_NEIAN|nr:DeoR/GlpR family DNA-binding transcription regulator [Neisseria animalis]QEY23349.1 DeoR/GlpR transcriptional regulator [Neisseria animalis]ROW33197.1 DeoR/GlpR transcriptional regulator [Neisseria animalis]VEE08738.1 DeoR family transcriptional regulator [Neisseria animalis]
MKPRIQRHENIITLVREQHYMSVEQLAAALDVTPQTIRRDINILSEENILRRYHGGATIGDVLESELQQGRRNSRQDEKNAIAQLIAEEIPDNASLFLSIGTTMEAVAAALIKKRRNLRIITNNIYVASMASARDDYTVIITSGVVRPIDGGVTGVATVDFINQFKVDYAVMSTHGVEADGSLLDYDYKEVSVMQAMMNNARVRFLGVDHSKFNSNALVRLGNITEFDKVFTDRAPEAAMQKILQAAAVEWLVPADLSNPTSQVQ